MIQTASTPQGCVVSPEYHAESKKIVSQLKITTDFTYHVRLFSSRYPGVIQIEGLLGKGSGKHGYYRKIRPVERFQVLHK